MDAVNAVDKGCWAKEGNHNSAAKVTRMRRGRNLLQKSCLQLFGLYLWCRGLLDEGYLGV